MSETARLNGQIPTDPIALIVALLASMLLARTLNPDEASTFQTVLPALLTAIPYTRR